MGLRPYTEPNGCAVSYAPFFCDYVYQVINTDPAFHQAATLLDGIGGLKIRTTLSPDRPARRAARGELHGAGRRTRPTTRAGTQTPRS